MSEPGRSDDLARAVAVVADPAVRAEAYEQLPVCVGTVSGADYIFVAANKADRAFSADRPLLGLPARQVFSETAGQQTFQMLDRAYTTGVAQVGREWRIQLNRGSGLVDVYIDYVISPIVGAAGQSTGLNILITEVTAQVQARLAAESQAREAERRYRAARDVVAELQGALLTTDLPVLPGASIGARYLVADHDQAAGGDWFDAIPLSRGRVALVVGDVVGHGVAASAAMGQLRSVLRTVLIETNNLDTALEWADRLAVGSPQMRAATILVAVLNPDTGAFRYATCGHPPLLVLSGDGTGGSRFFHRPGQARRVPDDGPGLAGAGRDALGLQRRLGGTGR